MVRNNLRQQKFCSLTDIVNNRFFAFLIVWNAEIIISRIALNYTHVDFNWCLLNHLVNFTLNSCKETRTIKVIKCFFSAVLLKSKNNNVKPNQKK